MQFSGTSTKHIVISLFVNVYKIHEIRYSISLYQFSICALLNACSVISYTTGLVQLNKDGCVWVCFEMARVQNVALPLAWQKSSYHPRNTENTGSMALA